MKWNLAGRQRRTSREGTVRAAGKRGVRHKVGGSRGKEETLLDGERKGDRAGHTKKGGQTTQRVGEEKREIHRKDDDYIMQPPKWSEIREEDAHRG